MRTPCPPRHGYPISAVPHATPREPQGPLALPGTYLVRLTVDGRRLEQPLTLKADPRVQLPASALADQLRLASELAGLLTGSSQTLLAAESEQAQLKALKPAGAAALAVSDYQARLAALMESKEDEGQPKTLLPAVQGRIGALYAELLRGDAPPTAAQLAATASLRESLGVLLDGWRTLQGGLPDLNRQLKAAGLAPVRAELAPPRDVNAADRD